MKGRMLLGGRFTRHGVLLPVKNSGLISNQGDTCKKKRPAEAKPASSRMASMSTVAAF